MTQRQIESHASAASPSFTDGGMWLLLRRTRRWVMMAEVIRLVCIAGAVFLAAVLTAVITDALMNLGRNGLMAVDGVLALIAVSALGFLIWRVRHMLFNARYLARLIESREQINDSRLINAVDFATSPPIGASRVLVGRSLDYANSLAASLAPRRAVDGRALRTALSGLAGVLAVALLIHLALPGVFGVVLKRLLSPSAFHPPYTFLQFDVWINPERVYVGKPAVITAEINGIRGAALPERATVAFLDSADTKPLGDGQPMLLSAGDHVSQRMATFLLPVERAESTRSFYIDTPGGRSAVYTLRVIPVPLFEHVSIDYSFPAYTGWAPVSRLLKSEPIQALEGTQVTITAASNLPLGYGTITLESDDPSHSQATIRMQPDAHEPRSVVGRLTIESNGKFKVSLAATDGTPSDEHREGTIIAVRDGPPTLEIIEPAQHVAVPEEYAVSVVVTAKDDVGVERITLSRSVNGMGPWPVDLPLQSERPSSVAAGYVFDLPQLGAKAGDVISYFATAYDNRPGAAQSADTPIFVIEVITTDEYMEYARTQYQMEQIAKEMEALHERLQQLKEQREKIVGELAALKQKAAEGQELSDADQQKMRELEQELKNYESQARELADDARERADQPQMYEFEPEYKDMLKSLADDLQRQAENAGETASAMQNARTHPSDSARQAMAQAAEQFMNNEAPFDQSSQEQQSQTMEDMERLRMADSLAAQVEKVRQLILKQRDLADRMAALRDQNDELSPADQLRAHRLADEQEQLRQELNEARKQLEQTAQQASERLPRMSQQAKGICQAISAMSVDEDQARAAESARDGRGRDAHDAAQQAAENLERLLSDCDAGNMQQQASDDLDGCLKMSKPGLRESMRQLAQGRSRPDLGPKGQRGSGFGGSEARMVVMGPQLMRRGEASDVESGFAMRGDGRGNVTMSDSSSASTNPERLDPQSASTRTNHSAAMAGVPTQFRDQAEAYFRRLARDSTEKRGDK